MIKDSFIKKLPSLIYQSTLFRSFILLSMVLTFSNAFGQLTYLNKIAQNGLRLRGALAIAISPDKKNIYATAQNSMSVFSYDTISGVINHIKLYLDNDDGFNGLYAAYCVIVSKNNKHVYVSSESENCISICERDSKTGLIKMNNIISTPLGAQEMVLTDDDRFLYLTAWNELCLNPNVFSTIF